MVVVMEERKKETERKIILFTGERIIGLMDRV